MIWDYLNHLVNETHITLETGIFKLILCMLAGTLIGINRQKHKEAAGLRTHILICVGSALLMMLSIYIPQTFLDFKNGDPGRIAAQVVTGIGFLGAGAIIRLGNNVKGLTTAASIWVISAVGLAIGAGMYILSFGTILISLFTLVILARMEKKLFPRNIDKTLTILFENHHFNSNHVVKLLNKKHIENQMVDITSGTAKEKDIELVFLISIPENAEVGELINSLYAFKGVCDVKIS